MPWWLWVLATPIIIVALLIAATHVDRWTSGFKSDVHLQDYRGASNGTLIVYLPGLIADGNDSSRTLRETWLKHGDVVTVSYTGTRFDAADVVKTVILRLYADTGHDKFVFIGSSMGGLLAVDIINQLRQDGNTALVAASSLVFVDSPSGSRDMLSGGNIGAPILRFLPFGQVSNNFVHLPLVPPKNDNIEDHLNRERVKAQAIEDMGKFPISIWRDQLAYMAAHPVLKPSDFAGLHRLVYLQCSRIVKSVQQNETIKQPQAAETWANVARGLLVITVDSTHCGYLERPKIWNKHFENVLNNNV